MKNTKQTMEQGTPIRVGRRNRPAESKLRALRTAMVALCGAILILGVLLTVLPLFRVREIIVEGNTYYTEEQILRYAGVSKGDEWLAIDGQAVANDVRRGGEYIDRVTVSGEFPFVLRITVVEKQVMYTRHNGTYYAFDDAFTVLAASARSEDFAQFLYVELPEISAIEVGYEILFANTEMDMSYILELRESLEKNGLLAHVTKLDCEKKYGVSVELGGTLRLTLGKVSDLDEKLALAEQILSERRTEGVQYVALDVSNLHKSTYRVLSEADFMANG